MAQSSLGDVLTYLRKVCGTQEARGRPDAELLARFLATRDEPAFAALVHRHGPMVLGVCRRLLGDFHSAEDVFQATFLVLARRAASIRKRDGVGTWLYGVARRVAAKTRAKSATRRNLERRLTDMQCSEPLDDVTWQELRGVLDEEISRLPEKYQAPLIFCYFEGKTHAQAAKELGWPKNTLTSRLERGRELLRQQLVRRGITLSAAALATALGEQALAAPVGAMLTINTVKAAMSMAAGKAVAGGCVSATAVALAEEAMTSMAAGKGMVVITVLALGLGIGGAGLAGYGGFAEREQPPKAAPVQTPQVKVENRGPQKKNNPLPTDLYGDPLPEGAVSRLGTIRFRHDATGTADIAYSPDGKVLASAGLFGFGVCLWDAATGQPLHQLSVPEASTTVAFSPDGKTLFAAGIDALTFIDVATGKELRRLDEGRNNKWSSAAFSPDGNLVAVGDRVQGGARVVLWDVVTCKEVRRVEWKVDETADYAGSPSVAFSPNGKLLASGSDDQMVHMWDVATGQELHRLKGHQQTVWSVAFAPDGKVLASAGGDGLVLLWEVRTGKPLQRLKTDIASFHKLAFAPGGKQFASGSRGGLCLWDLETGKELHRWPTFVGQMAFSPDGKILAAMAGGAALQRWDTATGKELGVVASHTSKIHSLHFAPDGKSLFSLGWDRNVLEWNLTNSRAGSRLFSEPLGTLNSASLLTAADLSADGKIVALALGVVGPKEDNADPAIHLVDTTTGKELQALDQQILVHTLKFSPNAKLLASSDKDALRLWDVATGKELVELEAQQRPDGQLAFSPDSSLLAYAGVNGTIRLWEIATRKELRRWDCGEKSMRLLVFSPDGRFIAHNTFSAANGITTATGGVSIWDCATGKLVVQFGGGEPRLRNILFSASARTIMVSEYQFRKLAGGDLEVLSTIHIREVLSGQEIRQIDTPQKQVDSLALSPDGRTLASGGSDSTILLWDLTGQAANGNQKPAPLTAAQLDSLWTDLAGDASIADRALWTLALAPAQSLPFLKTRMQPLPPAQADQVAKLIADLDSDRFAVRQEAIKALEQMGEPAEGALRKALESKLPLEVHQRVQQILEKGNKEIIRKLRAIETLEQIGNSEARQVLEVLANSAPNPRVTDAANAALKRLANRPAGTP